MTPRIVDQNVEAIEPLADRRHEAANCSGRRQVGGDEGGVPRSHRFIEGSLGIFALSRARARDHHVGTDRDELARGLQADARSSSGDQDLITGAARTYPEVL
jgi:hypothetical protein